ncbi:uncharacterized protein LOC131226975 [Magnolia sinica]|uniref:uncharacterized protein LOC131226975 n=1 Tax=Magnolia sinica TaxID=86752 RepID=UPI00265B2331|nr:uncharacterized protein LOC131226975 [Magnolia sinica]
MVRFNQKFFHEHVQEQRAMEFETLVQGDMTVSQYEACCLVLSRFTPYFTDDEKRKAHHFQKDLHPDLRSRVVGPEIRVPAEIEREGHHPAAPDNTISRGREANLSSGSLQHSSQLHHQRSQPLLPPGSFPVFAMDVDRQGIGGVIALSPCSSKGHRSCLLPILLSSSNISSEHSIGLPLLGLLLSSKGC